MPLPRSRGEVQTWVSSRWKNPWLPASSSQWKSTIVARVRVLHPGNNHAGGITGTSAQRGIALGRRDVWPGRQVDDHAFSGQALLYRRMDVDLCFTATNLFALPPRLRPTPGVGFEVRSPTIIVAPLLAASVAPLPAPGRGSVPLRRRPDVSGQCRRHSQPLVLILIADGPGDRCVARRDAPVLVLPCHRPLHGVAFQP